MSQPTVANPGHHSVWLYAALLLLGAAVCRPMSQTEIRSLPIQDFVEYWSAARLTLQGDNPYDLAAMTRQEHLIGRLEPLLMYNPPWTLAVLLPFGWADHQFAYLAWLGIMVSSLAGSVLLLWKFYGGKREHTGLGLILTFTFVPTFLALFLAQISPLLLVGAVLFLVAQRWRRFALAGAAAVLMAIKPQVTYLFWPAFVLWSLDRHRWTALAGALFTGLAATLLPLWWNPHLIGQYLDFLLHHPPAQYTSPTLGALLRRALGEDKFYLQYLVLLPGFAWFIVFYRRRRSTWNWGREMPWLLLVSMLTAAYGAWPFDLVLALVPVIQVAAATQGKERPFAGFHVAFNGAAAAMVACLIHFFWFLWMTPVLVLAYFLATRAKKSPVSNSMSAPAIDHSPALAAP